MKWISFGGVPHLTTSDFAPALLTDHYTAWRKFCSFSSLSSFGCVTSAPRAEASLFIIQCWTICAIFNLAVFHKNKFCYPDSLLGFQCTVIHLFIKTHIIRSLWSINFQWNIPRLGFTLHFHFWEAIWNYSLGSPDFPSSCCKPRKYHIPICYKIFKSGSSCKNLKNLTNILSWKLKLTM